jgi:hypothetical protein
MQSSFAAMAHQRRIAHLMAKGFRQADIGKRAFKAGI